MVRAEGPRARGRGGTGLCQMCLEEPAAELLKPGVGNPGSNQVPEGADFGASHALATPLVPLEPGMWSAF